MFESSTQSLMVNTYFVAKGHFLVTLGCFGPLASRRSYRTPFWTLWIADSIWSAISLFLMASLRLTRCALKAPQHSCSRSLSSIASELRLKHNIQPVKVADNSFQNFLELIQWIDTTTALFISWWKLVYKSWSSSWHNRLLSLYYSNSITYKTPSCNS